MEWTFDPLIVRNARFNLHKLGARFAEYLPQFYGEMRDGINAGQGSDRVLIRWDLTAPETAPVAAEPERLLLEPDHDAAPRLAAAADEVVRAAQDLGVVGLRVPTDVEGLRARSSELGAQWRTALRETMLPLLSGGWTVAEIRRDGTYVLMR